MIDSCKRASAERDHGRHSLLRLRPAGSQGRRPRADHGQTGRQPDHAGRRRPRADDGPARAADSRLLRYARSITCTPPRCSTTICLEHALAARTSAVVVSPDVGQHQAGRRPCQSGWAASLAIVDKRRDSAAETRQENIIGGPVDGKVAIMFDDMITTAGSICGAARSSTTRAQRDLRRRHARRLLRQRPSKDLRTLADHHARRHRHHPAAARKDAAQDQGALRRPAARRSHQADPPRSVDQHLFEKTEE